MNVYRKILAAVDLSDESAIILGRAERLARQDGAELHIVNVMEPILTGYVAEVANVDVASLQAEAQKQARDALLELAGRAGVPPARVHSVVGRPAREIHAQAQALEADLVVMGGHGKHGFELLLGSTSSGVTHGAPCDLLIVRLPRKADQ